MNICHRKYCDFFLWIKKDYFCRVTQDKDTWKTNVEKSELVFKNGTNLVEHVKYKMLQHYGTGYAKNCAGEFWVFLLHK